MRDAPVVVVDASVVVEYLLEAPSSRQATALFRRLTEPEPAELWAPDLLYLEVAAALRKLVRRKALEDRDGHKALTRLAALPLRCTGTRALLLDIWTLRHSVTPYDAAYLLLARELEAPLVTADARLVRAALHGHTVVHLADWPGQ